MSIASKLSPKDKTALALFYETESYGSLKKLFRLVRASAAEKALTAPDFNQVKFLQGEKSAIDRLEMELDKIHEADQKR